MKKLLFGAVAALAFGLGSLATAAPAYADYAAISAGVNGFGWDVGYTMENARDKAVRNCRQTYGSCSASTAEDVSWWYAAGVCDGVPYTGASPQGPERAAQIISIKGNADNNYNCRIWGVMRGYDMY